MHNGNENGLGEVVERKVHGEAEAKAGVCQILRRETPSVTQVAVGMTGLKSHKLPESCPTSQKHKIMTVGAEFAIVGSFSCQARESARERPRGVRAWVYNQGRVAPFR